MTRITQLLVFVATIFTPATSYAAERIRLTADTVFYVRPDGSNANSGLSKDKRGAWDNPQYALNYILDNVDFSGFNAKIELSAGRWAPPSHGYGYICNGQHVGRGELIIEGAGIERTIIDGTASSGAGFSISDDCTIYIQQLTIAPGPMRNGLQVTDNAHAFFGHVRWEGAKNTQIWTSRGAIVEQIGPDIIAGSPLYHVVASHSGHFRNVGQRTTFANDAEFTAYAYASSHGDVTYTYIDSTKKPIIDTGKFKISGRRCLADLNGIVQAAALGPNFFPGDIDCISTSGGQILQ